MTLQHQFFLGRALCVLALITLCTGDSVDQELMHDLNEVIHEQTKPAEHRRAHGLFTAPASRKTNAKFPRQVAEMDDVDTHAGAPASKEADTSSETTTTDSVPEDSVDQELMNDLSEVIHEQTKPAEHRAHGLFTAPSTDDEHKRAKRAETEKENGVTREIVDESDTEETTTTEAMLARELKAAEADLRQEESTTGRNELLSQQQQLALMLTRAKGGKMRELPVSGAASRKYLHSKAPIIAELSALKQSVSLPDGLKLRFTVRNPTSQHLRILNWETPFEGMLTNMFVIRDEDGIRIPYVGADARRRPPETATNDDFTMVPPKGKKSVVVDLARAYKFAKDGKYFFRVNQPKDSHVKYRDVMKSVVSVQVTNTKEVSHKPNTEYENAANPFGTVLLQNGQSHVGCTADQVSALAQWQADAEKWVEASKSCTVKKNDPCQRNVKLWFGNTTQSAFAFSVIKTLKNMHQRARDSTYRCGGQRCTKSTFGYVYPDDVDQNIFICPFSFSFVVQTEKRQTLIHELSHFNFIGVNENNEGVEGERDNSYGEVNCQDLAKQDSPKAMNNADNIAYFARDIALKSDPSCTDLSSSCPTWAATHNCDASYTGIGVLKEHCCKSCGHIVATRRDVPMPPINKSSKKHSGSAQLKGGWNALFAAVVVTAYALAH